MAIDLLAAFEQEPPTLDFIWPGFLAGTVGALIAPGATGKSFWALEAAMAVACAAPDGDLLGLAPSRNGQVLYLAGEDPVPALIRRVHAIGTHLPPAARTAIAANLVLEPIMGTGFNVMAHESFIALQERTKGHRLIVLDTLSRIHQLDENSNGDMSRLIARLECLAASTGAAVLYLHHASKGSARDGQLDQQQAARGASALIDNARWCGYVARMSENEADTWGVEHSQRGYFVRYGASKANYGDESTRELWFRRHEGGVLKPAVLAPQQRQPLTKLKAVARGGDDNW
ncbi:helicase RepA family protein [Bordetella trematum]|uniref:helicase RepA family protein n=1 Tax=Bordetella trematum TaxID=123899 RepID=UPI0015C55F95|nr:helicase RepA family protein [Bordetella trematum]